MYVGTFSRLSQKELLKDNLSLTTFITIFFYDFMLIRLFVYQCQKSQQK